LFYTGLILTRAYSLIVLISLFSIFAFGGIGEWKTYTSKHEIRGIAADKNNATLWAATSGGMFSYDFAVGSFQEFATSEGLQTIDLTAIAVDTYGSVWAGSSNGIIHVYTPLARSWKIISDLYLFNSTNKRINSFISINDTMFIL
jgi:ligand-binding sensor domain-containing protein